MLYDNVDFLHTNEMLEAIVNGMDLQKDDDVLAILGSGEQALAIIPYVKSVTAVDNNIWQMSYAKKRLRNLQNPLKYMLGSLCRLDSYNFGNYFSDERIIAARRRCGEISFVLADIFNYPWEKEKFSKAYLSNACRERKHLDAIALKLRNPGLIYVANGDCFSRMINSPLEEDWQLTAEANRKERYWHPKVFRRIRRGQ